MKTFLASIGVVIAFVLVFGVLVPSLELGYISYWRPKFQSVDRETFEQTKSYSNGMTSDLAKYYAEYKETDNEESKKAIREIVKIRFSNFDKSVVNEPMLVDFLVECRGF